MSLGVSSNLRQSFGQRRSQFFDTNLYLFMSKERLGFYPNNQCPVVLPFKEAVVVPAY